MNFLLIRFSSFGDVIITTSLVKLIKKSFPKSKVFFLTHHHNLPLLQGIPEIDQVFSYQKQKGSKDFKALKMQLEKIKDVDVVVDLHKNLRSLMVRLLTPGSFYISVFKRAFLRKMLVKFKINLMIRQPSLHSRLRSDFKFLLNLVDDGQLPKTLSPLNKSSHAGFHIVMAPGGSFSSKLWGNQRFEALIQRLLDYDQALKISVVAGPDDTFSSSKDFLDCQFHHRFENYKGKLDLLDSMKIVSQADYVIGNDSLFSHVAESMGIPCLTLFGSTHPDFGFRPHLENSEFIFKNIGCSPCSTDGKRKCFQKSHLCMEGIKVEEVIEAYSRFREERVG